MSGFSDLLGIPQVLADIVARLERLEAGQQSRPHTPTGVGIALADIVTRLDRIAQAQRPAADAMASGPQPAARDEALLQRYLADRTLTQADLARELGIRQETVSYRIRQAAKRTGALTALAARRVAVDRANVQRARAAPAAARSRRQRAEPAPAPSVAEAPTRPRPTPAWFTVTERDHALFGRYLRSAQATYASLAREEGISIETTKAGIYRAATALGQVALLKARTRAAHSIGGKAGSASRWGRRPGATSA